jgi:hypothetical protein
VQAWVEPVAFYSSDWGAAGLLMDALKQRGLVVFIKADGLRNGTFSPGYTAIVGNMPRTDADTGPKALALAAKKYYSPYANI